MGRIFWKLFVAIFLATLLGLLGTATYFSLSDQDINKAYSETKAALLLDAAEAVATNSGIDPALAVARNWNGAEDPPHLTVLDSQGKSLTSPLFSTEGTHKSVVTPDGKHYVLAVDVKASNKGLLRPALAVPLISGTLFGFIVSVFLAWYFTRPIRYLRWALKEVSLGKFDTRVSQLIGTRRDEIADLGHDVDLMTAHLEQLISSRQRLFHDISHELRSPLARIQVAIGLLRQNPARAESMVDRIDREVERLNYLVEQILTLARLTAKADFKADDNVDVIELLASIVDDACFEAESKNRSVRLTAGGAFISRVNGEVLCRAFENIIRNAVKYTKAGTSVDVHAALSDTGDALHISVTDHGPGIPQEEAEKIFEPFCRLDTEQPSAGFGLGLAIARKAIEIHHGQISIENIQDGGLCVKITLPEKMV